jgi:hypothetical protein
MTILPNVELNLRLGGPPQAPDSLPPCERFLVPGSMLPMQGARGPLDPSGLEGGDWMPPEPLGQEGGEEMPPDPLGQEGGEEMPPDPLGQEGGEEMPPDPLGHLNLSWTPLDPLKDDGEHGDGAAGSMMDDGVQWRVELVGPTGELGSMATSENSIPLSAFGIPAEQVGSFFDRLAGESFFWRLTGEMPSEESVMQPFCRPTNWMSFQLGAPESLPPLPWLASAPPAPEPPTPSEPTPIDEGEAVPPEPCTPTFTATMNLTCRSGPASVYDELGYLLQGESATIEGRNDDSTWWWIPNPDWQGHCWVWDGGGDATCIPEDLREVAAPPLPTPTPTPLACRSDLDRDACIEAGGNYVDGGLAAASHCECP